MGYSQYELLRVALLIIGALDYLVRHFLQECLSACCPCPETVRKLAGWPTLDLNGPRHLGKHGQAVPGEGPQGLEWDVHRLPQRTLLVS